MLEKYRDEILSCTGCGFCKKLCPLYHLTKKEVDGPKGKIMIAYGLLTGEIKEDNSIIEALQKTPLCRICETTCPSLIKITDIIKAARHDLKKLLPAHEKLIEELQSINEKPEGEKIIFAGMQAKEIEAIKKISSLIDASPYYGGCGAAIERIGRKNNIIEKILQNFREAGVKEIIFYECDCMKFFSHDFKVSHIFDELKKFNLNYIGGRYIYHEPPELSYLGIDGRSIIKKIGEIVEFDSPKCCGGRIEFERAFPDEAKMLAKDLIKEAKNKNATIVTASPECYAHLKKYGNIIDMLELVERAMD